MEYTILGILLMIIMLLYFKVADRFNIIDKPNQRSSHTEITLRGGGVIFWFSALLHSTMWQNIIVVLRYFWRPQSDCS